MRTRLRGISKTLFVRLLITTKLSHSSLHQWKFNYSMSIQEMFLFQNNLTTKSLNDFPILVLQVYSRYCTIFVINQQQSTLVCCKLSHINHTSVFVIHSTAQCTKSFGIIVLLSKQTFKQSVISEIDSLMSTLLSRSNKTRVLMSNFDSAGLNPLSI